MRDDCLVMEEVGWMSDRNKEQMSWRECSCQALPLSVVMEWQVPWTSRHRQVPIDCSHHSPEHIKDQNWYATFKDDLLPRTLLVDLTARTVSQSTIHFPEFERWYEPRQVHHADFVPIVSTCSVKRSYEIPWKLIHGLVTHRWFSLSRNSKRVPTE